MAQTNLPADAKTGSIRSLFESDKVQTQLKRALPSVLTVDELIRVSLTVIRTNPKLLECSQQSLLACLFGCGQLGLVPEPHLGQAYFVPFWNSKLRSMEAQLIPGYRGYITLARRSGELANLSAQAVYENDHFRIQWGLIEVLEHVPADTDRGDFKGAWTVFKYREGFGSPTFEYLPKHDIDKIMERTKSRDRSGNLVGPWVTDYEEMAKKSVIRRHIKLAPLSVKDNRLHMAAHAENLALDGGQSGFFLPDEGPIEISGGSAGRKSVDDMFNEQFTDLAGDPLLEDFLEVCASHYKKSITDIKSDAMSDPSGFEKAFESFKQKRPEKTDGARGEKSENVKYPENLDLKWSAFRSQWINKKTAGFDEVFIRNHKVMFLDAPAELVKEAKEKWAKIHGDAPWPLDKADEESPEEGKKDPGATMDQGEKSPETGSVAAAFGANGGDSGENAVSGPPDGAPLGNSVSGEELYQTDEWSELMMLKEKEPKAYLKVLRGSTPTTLGQVRKAIEAIGVYERTGNLQF